MCIFWWDFTEPRPNIPEEKWFWKSHCSGYARGRDLLEAVSEISVKTLYPVHTDHPNIFEKVAKNRILINGVMHELTRRI